MILVVNSRGHFRQYSTEHGPFAWTNVMYERTKSWLVFVYLKV